MFTVLIAEKEHIQAIQQDNRLFFEPFLDNKELAFCEWNPAGQNLLDSVPRLMDIVGRRKQWRAVVINNVTEQTKKFRNPFDMVDFSSLAEIQEPDRQPEVESVLQPWVEAWETYHDRLCRAKEEIFKSALELPLQKLSTWLCYRPEDFVFRDVEEKYDDIHDWALMMLGRDELKPSARLELMERNQYKWELRKKELLRREFVNGEYLNIAYPQEMHCISIRTTDKNFFDPDAYWTVRRESEYSAFADRNMYFDKMRFMVFDLYPETHRDFRTDYIRFLATVLVYVSNPVPPSAMLARRLYNLETETDDTPLCTMVTSYDRKLSATAEVIENEMEKIRGEIPDSLTDKAAEELFCQPTDVTVVLDRSCDPAKILAEKDYGLFFDSPENELDKWKRSYRNSREHLVYVAKQQSRSVRKSVTQMHLSSEVTDVNVSRLTPLQIDDIRDYTNNAENEMIDSIPPDMTEISRYTKRLEEESENVKKTLRQRMTQKTTLILGGVCLALYLICFLPFLFSNTGTARTVSTAVVLSGSMLGIMALVMFGALIFMRKSVRDAVGGYNNVAGEIINDIETCLSRFSKYLSDSCNVRRGHAVQQQAEQHLDIYTKGLRIRKKHLEDVRRKRAYLAEDYRDYFGDKSFCDETMSRPYDYDFDQRVEYPYPAPFLAGDRRQIEFVTAGNYVTVPSSYVTSIQVRLEGIYE